MRATPPNQGAQIPTTEEFSESRPEVDFPEEQEEIGVDGIGDEQGANEPPSTSIAGVHRLLVSNGPPTPTNPKSRGDMCSEDEDDVPT